MVLRQAGKQQDRQDRQDITTVYHECTEIAHTKIPSRAIKKLGAVYKGRPANGEGGGFEISDIPRRGEGGGL